MNDNDIKLDRDIKRKSMAEDVANNPIYVEAITAMKGELYRAFTATKFADSSERDEIWRKQQCIDWFERYLRQTMDTGRLAENTLKERLKRKLKLA